MMCYFNDEKKVYYYLDNVGRYVYENMIDILEGLEIKKKKKKKSVAASEHIGSSSYSQSRFFDRLLYDYANECLDGLVINILTDSQVRETHLHAHIDIVANEVRKIIIEDQRRSKRKKREDPSRVACCESCLRSS